MRHSTPISARLAMSVASLVLCAFACAPLGAFAQAASDAAAAPAAATPAPEAASAAVPAPMTAARVSKETVDNPYGLGALWEQGDFVARGTLIILVAMSMGSWYILITKLYESLKLSSEAKTAQRTFFKSKSLRDGAQALKNGGAFRFIADSGIEASEH